MLRIDLRVLIILLLCTVVLTSCTSHNVTEEQEKISLSFRHFWISQHDQQMQDVFLDVIKQFESDHPHIKIEFEGINQTIHREQKLRGEMVTGMPPDIFALFGGGEIEPFVRGQRLMDLTEFLEEHQLMDQFVDLSMWTFNGRIYGLPIEGNITPLFYNKEIFEVLGLEPPRDLDHLIRIVEKIRERGLIPFAFGNDERWPGGIYYQYLLHRYGGNHTFEQVLSGELSFNNPQYVRATDAFIRMMQKSPFPVDPNIRTRDYAVELFTLSKAAMYLNGSWDITLFQEGHAPAGFEQKVGVMNFPVVKPFVADTQGLAGGYTMGIGVSNNLKEQYKEAALLFLKAIYSPEIQTRILYEANRLPSMNIPISESEIGPVLSQVMQLIYEVDHRFIPYDNMLPTEIKEEFLTVANDLIALDISSIEALERMNAVSEQYWSNIRQEE